MLGVLVVQLILLAWICYNYRHKLKTLFGALVNREVEKQDFEKRLNWTDTYSQAFIFLFFINVSWLIYMAGDYYGVYQNQEIHTFLIFLFIFIVVVLLYFLKVLLINVVNYLVGSDFGLNQYLYSIGIHYQLVALLLTPVVALLAFSPIINVKNLLLLGGGVYAIVFLKRVFQGVRNSVSNHASPFYIILYLCTFEFLPIVIASHLIYGEIIAI